MGTQKFENLPVQRYLDVRGQIQNLDLLFAAGNYPISRMIEYVTNSMFSHVAFVFHWNSRVLLFESVEDKGVRIGPLSQYVSDYENSGSGYNGRLFIARYDTVYDPNKCAEMLGDAADLLNRKYDQEEIARILARITMRLGNHSDNNTYICSEFVDVCFQHLNIIFPRDPNGFIFPEHIAADPKMVPLWEIVD